MNTIAFWVIIVNSINLFANIGIMLFFQYRKLEQLESYLAGNKWVEWNKAVCGDRYRGRQLRLSAISAIVFLPHRLHCRGNIAKNEDKKIPKKLRLQLKALYAHMALTMSVMTVLYFVLE